LRTIFFFLSTLSLTTSDDGIDESAYHYATDKCGAPRWTPFTLDLSPSTAWVRYDDVIAMYGEWHNQTLFGVNRCEDKQVVIFEANAGLGDSIGAATSAFTKALQTGRLFFINWKPFDWSLVLRDLPFNFDYNKVVKLRGQNGLPLICPDIHHDVIKGHITFDHPLASADVINHVDVSYQDLIVGMFQPSPQVQQMIIHKNHHYRQVALVIRTGETEYNQFLSAGDERIFVRCLRNFLRRSPGRSHQIFVTSDSDRVKRDVIEQLHHMEGELPEVEIRSLDDSIVHVMAPNSGDDVTRIRKTFAEYFTIASSDVMFLTHGSLFGQTAAERRMMTTSQLTSPVEVYYLSDSNCDGTREKYSYLRCHVPKYPPICDDDVIPE